VVTLVDTVDQVQGGAGLAGWRHADLPRAGTAGV